MPVVALVGTLDTKGPELRYLRDVFGNPGQPMLRTPPAEVLDSSGVR